MRIEMRLPPEEEEEVWREQAFALSPLPYQISTICSLASDLTNIPPAISKAGGHLDLLQSYHLKIYWFESISSPTGHFLLFRGCHLQRWDGYGISCGCWCNHRSKEMQVIFPSRQGMVQLPTDNSLSHEMWATIPSFLPVVDYNPVLFTIPLGSCSCFTVDDFISQILTLEILVSTVEAGSLMSLEYLPAW